MKLTLLITGLLILAGSAIFAAPLKRAAAEHFEHWNPDGTAKSHLEQVNRKARTLEHYEDLDTDEDFEIEDFEQEAFEQEFLEETEYFKRRKGANPTQARALAYKKLSNKHGRKFQKAMSKKSLKNANPGAIGTNPFYDAAAQFDITITRNTVTIASALTVPLFASVHFDAKYLSIMGSYLPAGVTITTIAITSTGDVTFTLNSGANNDTITVSCTQIPYITFLNALNYTAMRLSKIRYSISDVTKLQQFNQPFEVYSKSIFGKHGGNGLSLAAVNDPKNLNNGVRDLDNTIDINNETAVIIGIINTAGFSVCISAWVQGYNRTNR